MYTQGMIRLYRSPEGGEGGGTGDDPAGDPGAAAGAGAAEGGAAGGSAPQYATKADLEAFASRFEQNLSRFSRPEPKSESQASPSEPKKPNVKDYDFQKDPDALERWQQDTYKWLRHQEKAQEAEERTKSEREASVKKNESGHLQRVQDYRKANPEFDADMKKAGNILVVDEVKHAIFASKNSAAVQHYLAKNPGAADDLNLLAQTEGLESVRERIGEMAADMRRAKESLNSTESAARVRPPRQNLRGGSSSGNRNLSQEERFQRFNEI